MTGLTIALHITWPLVQGDLRDVVTVSAVQTLAAAALLHAWGTQGSTYASRLASVALLGSYTVTALGIVLADLGFSARLGPQVGGVPLMVPLAWLTLLHLGLELARRCGGNTAGRVVVAGCTVGMTNLYFEPQLAGAGYLTWSGTVPDPTAVLMHTVVWILVAAALAYAVIDIAGPGRVGIGVTMPLLALLWVWLGPFLADALPMAPFLAQPGVAVRGLVGMGLVLVPAGRRAWRRR